MSKRENKALYFQKLTNYLDTYQSIFIVNVDNVSSNQMHQIRFSLRGEAVVLMGKNTMVRRALKGMIGERPELEKLLNFVKGNIGFVFTNGDLKDIREKIVSNRVAAPARAGAVAPADVIVPGGNTVWNQERPLSSKLSVSPPRLPVVPLKSFLMSSSSNLVPRSVLPRLFF